MDFSAHRNASSYKFRTANSGCVVCRDVGITGVAEIVLETRMQERAAGRVALVAGATGLVRREILATILADDTSAPRMNANCHTTIWAVAVRRMSGDPQ